MEKKGNEVRTHWIVKVASIYIWIMFLSYFIPFYLKDEFDILNTRSIFFLLHPIYLLVPQILLTLITWKSTEKRMLLYCARFSFLLPLTAASIDPVFLMRIIYFYIGGMAIYELLPSPLICGVNSILSIASIIILIKNAWYPIRSKGMEVKV